MVEADDITLTGSDLTVTTPGHRKAAAEAIVDARERMVRNTIRKRLFPAATSEDSGPAATVGRFVVESKLGEGGMGVVFAGYDRRLDRRVAIKVLRSTLPAHATRLEREAQALARLSHPNVVQIHEIGTHEGEVFMAMEFVAGDTFRRWQGPSRTWRDILGILLQAGRGLAAAHAAGLVHRDFKPDNVMVGEDGRARVLDFGLARGVTPKPDERDETLEDFDRPSLSTGVSGQTTREDTALDQSLTIRGVVMGTPAYMAPEQHRGESCTALADQFAFCVTAYEALYEGRPFPGRTMSALLEAVLEQKIRPVPPDSEVPRAVRDAILRGLAVEPGDRWPTMDALLEALESETRQPRRRHWGALAAGLAGATLAAGLAFATRGSPPEAGVCEIDSAVLAGTWDADRRGALADAFTDTNLPYAASSLAVVDGRVQAWADDWLDQRRRTCEATHVEGVQSSALLDLRTHCLERHRVEADAVITTLIDGGVDALANSEELLAQLPEPSTCALIQPDREADALPDDPVAREATLAAFEQLGRARALLQIGHGDEAEALLDEVDRTAPDSGALEVERLLVRGQLAKARGEITRTIELTRRGAARATQLGLDQRAATAQVSLARQVGGLAGNPQLELLLIEDARVAIDGVDGLPAGTRVLLAIADARYHMTLGDHEQALALLDGALANNPDAGPDLRVDVRQVRADALHLGGDPIAARREYTAVLAELEERWGPSHPRVANSKFNLADLEMDEGNLERAATLLDESRAILAPSWGEDSAAVALVDVARARLALGEGDTARARALCEPALEILARDRGPDHDETSQAANLLGVILFYEGDYEGSVVAYRRALAALERTLGPDSVDVALVHGNIGESLAELERWTEAEAELAEAMAAFAAAGALDSHFAAASFKTHGLILDALGERERAIQQLERAVELHERHGAEPYEGADARFALAKRIYSDDPDRAVALATEALETFESLDQLERVEHIRAWLP